MSDELSIAQTLAPLERRVFESVRHLGQSNVAEVAAHLEAGDRPLAYTTVMTILSRLFQKGYLLRQRQGKAYVYAARAPHDIAEGLASQVARDSINRYGNLALSGFVQTLTADQRALLSELLHDGSGGPVADTPGG